MGAVSVSTETQPRLEVNTPATPGRSQKSWLWLLLGSALLLFANGRDTVPIAAWLGPVFLLRFVRLRRPLTGLLVAFAAMSAVYAFQYRGMVPVPGAYYFIVTTLIGITSLLPYVLDRLLYPRLRGFTGTLLFPLAWAALGYLTTRSSIYGSWGSEAYSQYGNLPLLQLLSITGLAGIEFLIAWFASACNFVWEQGWNSRPARQTVLIYAIVIVGVLLYGGLRLAVFPPAASTVRVATLTRPEIEFTASDDAWEHLLKGSASAVEIADTRSRTGQIADNLFTRAGREAQGGAKIISWGETNLPVLKADEPALLLRAGDFAHKNDVYLLMAVGVLIPGAKQPVENKVVFVSPGGEILWQYSKVRPVPGPEAAMQVPGDGRIRTANTPYGRIGTAICFDMDFPKLLQQAGAQRADLMIVPSNDWRAIDPYHTQMAAYRAVEEGFNLVRHTSQGLSLAVDYQGRVLGAMDHYHASDRVLVAQLPTRGVRTIYSRVGDLFAWLCIAGLVLVGGKALARK